MSNSTEPRWIQLARAFLLANIREVEGTAANPLIAYFLNQFTQLEGSAAAKSDETPWCSAFACGVMELAGYASPHHALARSWDTYGDKLDGYKYGCITTLRDDNHVGFAVDFDVAKHQVLLLGGNQSNSISIKPYDAQRVVQYRWPFRGLS